MEADGAGLPGAGPPQPASGRPAVWPPARWVIEAVFTGLARALHARAFHPRGLSFIATLHAEAAADPLPFLAAPRQEGLVRLSKAVGLPSGAPDLYGLALRVPDVYGTGRHQDVLLTSAGQRPLLRHVVMPTRGFDRPRYSSVLTYRHHSRLVLLGAHYAGPARRLQLADLQDAAIRGQLVFELSAAGLTGPWQPVARLVLERPMPADASEQLRFHPWNTAAALRPAGLVNRLRAPAYEASQRTATSE